MDTPNPDELSEDELRAWDWRAALAADDRSIPWLARKTDRSDRTVYSYAYEQRRPPIAWLRSAAQVLGFRQVAR